LTKFVCKVSKKGKFVDYCELGKNETSTKMRS
jgi:hypothetical protein